jgi:MFS family permease
MLARAARVGGVLGRGLVRGGGGGGAGDAGLGWARGDVLGRMGGRGGWARGMAVVGGEDEGKARPRVTGAGSVPALLRPETALGRAIGPASAYAREGQFTASSRWVMVAPAFLTHMAIGSPYAWSAVSGVLAHELGVVAAAADDWSLSATTVPLSLVFFGQGIAAAVGGTWLAKVGPRAGMTIAAAAFGGGVALAALGVWTHSLPLVYAGYGVLAGTGVGLGYTPPLQTLMEWLPDRRGLASGLVIAGFGSGALFFSPAVQKLTRVFFEAPEFAGPKASVRTIIDDTGRVFAETDSGLREVVLAKAKEMAKLGEHIAALPEGYYFVGTGNTGAAAALGVLGATYFSVMLASALFIRRPPAGFSVGAGAAAPRAPAALASGDPGAELGPKTQSLPADIAAKTPQFWLLATTFGLIATGGLGVLSVAKPMMAEVFSSALPEVVTAAFASNYVMMLAVGNLGGRLGWSGLSDAIGRRPTFHVFNTLAVPIFLALPAIVAMAVEQHSAAMLYAFILSTVTTVSVMGGTYACLPAYEADLFGPKNVGAIHGRNLLASSAAALGGPALFLYLRNRAHENAVSELLPKIDPKLFLEHTSKPIDAARDLLASKTISIHDLAHWANAPDPSPFLYDSSMYTIAALGGLAFLSHSLIRPVDRKYFELARQRDLQLIADQQQQQQNTKPN